jgi:RNA-directed DNA polymerase
VLPCSGMISFAYQWLCQRRRDSDDILILAPTRWQLRGAVKVVNETLGTLSLEKHPDKTFIGKIERGFDFLGYHFSSAGLTVAKQTITNFIEKASRLYEQERRAVSAVSPLEVYVRQWLKWARAGVSDIGRGRRVPPPRRY